MGTEYLFEFSQKSDKRNGLNCFAEAHFICQDAIDASLVEGYNPIESSELVILELAAREGTGLFDESGGDVLLLVHEEVLVLLFEDFLANEGLPAATALFVVGFGLEGLLVSLKEEMRVFFSLLEEFVDFLLNGLKFFIGIEIVILHLQLLQSRCY